MSDEPQELKAARDRLSKGIRGMKVKCLPRFRDVAFARNEYDTKTSIFVWFRFVLLVWPSLLIEQVKTLIGLLAMVGAAAAAVAFAFLIALLRLTIYPVAQLIAAVFGHLTIRYTPETLREIYGESIRKLPAYAEFEALGGKLDLNAVPVTPEFLASIQDQIASRAETEKRGE